MLPHISCSGAGMSLNLQSLVEEKCPSMSVWAFCVHRQINRAGGVTDPNNLVHYSRRFQMPRKVPIFPKSSLGPSCLLQVCDPRWALLSRGGGGGVVLQQTGVVAMTPCISTSNKTAWKPLKEVKLPKVPEAIASESASWLGIAGCYE